MDAVESLKQTDFPQLWCAKSKYQNKEVLTLIVFLQCGTNDFPFTTKVLGISMMDVFEIE